MRALRILLPLAVLAVGIALAVAIIFARPKVQRQSAAALPPLIRTVEVEPRDVVLTVHTQGTVKPEIESTLVAEVSGRIVWVSPSFAEGGFFRDGDKLLQIDDRDYRVAASQAEAQVAQSQVRLELELAEARVARQEWEDLGRGPADPLTLRQPQLGEARALLEGAEATLRKANLDLERTSIRAPFDGRVRNPLVDLGQFVVRGGNLAAVYSTEAAELRLLVPKDQLAFLDLAPGLGLDNPASDGPEVLLRGEIGGQRAGWNGRIVRIGSEFDPKTRMLPLFARIEDPFRRRPNAEGTPLPVGLFVDAEIAGRRVREVVVLPRQALRGAARVLVVDSESRLRYRDIELLRTRGNEAFISSGLEAGELVCVSPLETVVDGMRVRVAPASDAFATDADREEQL